MTRLDWAENLRLLKRLVAEAEDAADRAAAQKALDEPGERIPYSEYRHWRLEQSDGERS